MLKISFKYLIATVALLAFYFCGFAQQTTTPAGIPSSATLMRIWLETDDVKADMKTTTPPTDASALTFWMDKSGNGFNFSQSTNSKKPRYYNNFGGFPAILFDDVTAGAKHTMNPVVTQANLQKGAVYFVLNGKYAIGTERRSNVIMEDKRNTGDGSLRFNQFDNSIALSGKVGFTLYQVDDYQTTYNSPYEERSIISYRKALTSTNVTVKVKSGTQNIGIGSETKTIPIGSLGTNTNTPADYSNMYFHEVIIYDFPLNEAQTFIIENHLAAKYSGTSGNSLPIPTSYYSGANATNGNFDFDVIGIGQAANTLNNSLTALNSFGFTLNGLTSFPNNTYVMMGHNDSARTVGKSWVSDTYAPTITSSERFDRIWYVDHSGTSTDKVDVQFNFTDAKSTYIPSGEACRYKLLRRSGTSGAWTVFASASSFSGSTINFSNVTFTDGYYTIGRVGNTIINAITNNQTITCGSAPANLTGGSIVGATYQWQMSTDTIAWSNVSSAGTSQNYAPPALGITTWFRRNLTLSGCISVSNLVKVTVTSAIAVNNIKLNIAANDTICYNTSPGQLKTDGTALGATYTYQWYQKIGSGSWTLISGATSEAFTPSALTVSTLFRRTNTTTAAPFCGNNSNELLVTVKPIVPKQGPILGPETACKNSSGHVYDIASTDDATYTWTYSGTGATITSGASTSAITVSYAPTATNGNWKVVMTYNGCTSVASDPINVVLNSTALPTIATVSNKTHCTGITTTLISFSGTGATSYNWTNSNTAIGLAASGTGNIAAFTTTNTGTTAIVSTVTVTPYNATTGCSGISTTFTITINPKPNGTISLVNPNICIGTGAQLIFTATAGPGPYSLTVNGNNYTGIVSGTPFLISPIPLVTTPYNLTKITDSNGCVR